MTEALIIKSLTKTNSTYADKINVLDDINLTVAKGEFVAILGASNSGKTTLLNILTGLENATGGAAYIDGRDVTKMSKDEIAVFRRQKTGSIFREINLLDSLSVRENIALPLTIDGKQPSEIDEIIDGMMDFLGIEGLAAKMVNTLTGEEKQLVSAARALVVNPIICFADEPTGGLDSNAAANIMEMLEIMNANSETTILLATHDAFVASYCSRVVFIVDGKIVLDIVRNGSRIDFLKRILSAQFQGAWAHIPKELVQYDADDLQMELDDYMFEIE